MQVLFGHLDAAYVTGDDVGDVKAPVKRKTYEAPAVSVLGSLHALTLHTKVGHSCDVTCYHHGSH